MPNIPEGGAIGDSFVDDSLQIRPLTAKEILTSQNLQDPSIRQTTIKDLLASQSLQTWESLPKKTSCSQRLQDAITSWQINVEEHPCFYSNVEEINNNTSDYIEIDTDNLPINVNDDI
ncbi:ca2+ alpha subunit [Lasius niger]|uniref:Ca2+ alpha subunit n=1 Tax=Lasius niger TaxID=67767 RepID=A0A0J7JZY8_LASNI|nr:ca2+ alpha subunit [Lasius niger]